MMSGVELGLVVVVAAVISAGLLMALLPWLRRRLLAHPNARSSHIVPTPQGGGIAVVAATIVVAAGGVALGLTGPAFDPATLWIVLGAVAFLALVGAVDDIHTIEVAPRLALQAIAVGAVIACLPTELRVVPQLPWWTERALLLIACVWFVNLTNFMDGIDWITVAEIVPVAAGIAILGLIGALPSFTTLVALALAGALIGFAPFNRPVARIFLGDVGSLPIGLLIAWLLMLVACRGHLAAAAILPLYYLADATLTLIRRIVRREPFWRAHRSHFYQVATDRGFSVTDVVARVFAVNVGLVVLASASVYWPSRASSAIALFLAVLLVSWLLRALARGKN